MGGGNPKFAPFLRSINPTPGADREESRVGSPTVWRPQIPRERFAQRNR